jgi:hypothetical protein
MGSKDGRQVHLALFGQREGYPRKPFVEVSDNCAIRFA